MAIIGSTQCTMHNHMNKVAMVIVHGDNVGTIPFKRSGMQSHMQIHSKFEFKLKPYGQMLKFTQFKLVKHEKRSHIHNPCIFLIILDILYASFGVRMNLL